MLAILYLAGASIAGLFWLSAFLKDRSTPKTDLCSWLVLLLAVAVWPISYSLAYLERSKRLSQF